MRVVYEPEGTRPVSEQFPSELRALIKRLEDENWASKINILDTDYNRHLVFLAFDPKGELHKSDPVSVYNLGRLTAGEMVKVVRASLGL